MNSRLINILVDGSHLTKDRGTAGVQHEGNSTVLRIKFDESWDNLAKSVTWWNAKGLNPVVRVLTVDMLEDIQTDTRVYRCPIPAEPLTEAGMCTFVIDGFLDGKRQRSVSDQLKVTAAPYAANAGAAADPTPTQAEQLQTQMEAVLGDIQRAIVASDTAGAAIAEAAAALQSAAQARTEAEMAEAKAKEAQALVESTIYHAPRHAAGGEDPITPAMIGAVSESDIYRPKYCGVDCVADLNDFRGYWSGTFTGATTANVPDATVPFYDVWLSGGSPRFMTQYASVVNETRTYLRKYCDGIWTAWIEDIHSDISPSKIFAAQANSVYDIDAVYPTGLYRVAGSGGTFPAGSEAGIGTLINTYWDANYVDQVFISYTTFKMYRRRRNGVSWEPWYMVYDEHSVTKSPVDIGEGAAMAPGSWYAVYE